MPDFIPYELIMKKRDGAEHTKDEIEYLIREYTKGNLPDYQMSAWLMAVYFRKMTSKERAYLTMAMAKSGDMIDLSFIKKKKVDKHSTGGVGDKVSIPLAPLVASYGVSVPMMSGRGLGHTGGTLDKLESIPGFRTNLSETEYKEIVSRIGVAIISQTERVAPADKKMYALRDVTATVDNLDLITASILSKKLAAGPDAIVLDVKTGSGAFMQRFEDSKALAIAMVDICKNAGKDVVALITDMDQPLGEKIGNALEIEESIEVLKDQGPPDVVEIVLELGGWMLVLGEKAGSLKEGREMIKKAIANSQGLKKFESMVKAQGGDPLVVRDLSILPKSSVSKEVLASKSGIIVKMDAREIGISALLLGAGRETKDSKLDLGAGIVLHKKVGDRLKKEESIATLYSANNEKLEKAKERFIKAIEIRDKPPQKRPLIFETIKM
ncbi:MAG: thymidine phosphorylase [Candidatus Hydrogenedentota bacterium]